MGSWPQFARCSVRGTQIFRSIATYPPVVNRIGKLYIFYRPYRLTAARQPSRQGIYWTLRRAWAPRKSGKRVMQGFLWKLIIEGAPPSSG